MPPWHLPLQRYVGKLATAMDGISVERAQDLAHVGKGQISIVGNKVTGHGTSFTSDLKPRFCVVPTSGPYAGDKVG